MSLRYDFTIQTLYLSMFLIGYDVIPICKSLIVGTNMDRSQLSIQFNREGRINIKDFQLLYLTPLMSEVIFYSECDVRIGSYYTLSDLKNDRDVSAYSGGRRLSLCAQLVCFLTR